MIFKRTLIKTYERSPLDHKHKLRGHFDVIFDVILLALSGCAFNFDTPKTPAGAACKQDCSKAMLACNGSSYTCDKGYNRCTDSCAAAEGLSSSK